MNFTDQQLFEVSKDFKITCYTPRSVSMVDVSKVCFSNKSSTSTTQWAILSQSFIFPNMFTTQNPLQVTCQSQSMYGIDFSNKYKFDIGQTLFNPIDISKIANNLIQLFGTHQKVFLNCHYFINCLLKAICEPGYKQIEISQDTLQKVMFGKLFCPPTSKNSAQLDESDQTILKIIGSYNAKSKKCIVDQKEKERDKKEILCQIFIIVVFSLSIYRIYRINLFIYIIIMLKVQGSKQFRQRIVCSLLSGRAVKITNIRDEDERPGLADYEASFLRLIDKMTNGTRIEINNTGTMVTFHPGVLTGGKLQHDCPTSRAIGYFVEAVVCIAPFSKAPVDIAFTGLTNNDIDLTIDTIRTTTLPIIRKFLGGEEGDTSSLSIKIVKRGAPPSGGGLVYFKCPIVQQLKPLQMVDEGKIRRIRGISYATRVSPAIPNRVLDSAKGILLQFTPDVYISSDIYKGAEAGSSPGYGLTLVAETTTGCCLSAECMASEGEIPEDLGQRTANLLLEEILNGGCIDSNNQSLALLFMILCPEDVSKVRLGRLTPYTIEYIRHLKEFFGVTFKIEADDETKTIIFTCLGIGYKNLARRTF
ncbi:RNA 3'-terminal phosphate cyclase family protein [Cavenderia fasciculata]|uniref:RNA 3'-terminal phosphate cyclase family protein n=1 Tax=Cavenderia fasciculata TaxID=261658 RepID=F4Q8W0_CACFS|nr:RNA 3'-terminal phosphate cyclase family protein [Cavenderia fasciculata]EGG15129.1 RNA 3'-terminal phosphate cyclase family protein [Cavenderia fasciculata]|eukprot:XP_004351849.1 RNA 3'-terminal phosphate cyclase family protein [Cavenderia fasciculata]